MDSILNILPFPFDRPEAQQLLETLIKLYGTREKALALAEDAGLDTTDIDEGSNVTLFWRNILKQAAIEGPIKTRKLVENAHKRLSDTNTNRPFLTALLDNKKPVLSSDSSNDDGDPAFLANSDTVMEPEALLYRDDLMIRIGQVPQLIRTLQRLVEIAPAVCRLSVDVNRVGQYGTAFRIGPHWLLTNWHVVHDKRGLKATTINAEFWYEDNEKGGFLTTVPIGCSYNLIATDKTDDWAVVQTTDPLPDSIPIISLEAGVVPKTGESAYIIQHPNGDRKRLGYVRNQVSFVNDQVIHYLTDTQSGSSGSPVFNEEGYLIALHHRGGTPQNVLGKEPFRKNEGIRISRIVKGLTEKGINLDA